MNSISSYFSCLTASTQRQQNEPSSRAGTSLNRDTRSQASLARTTGRISNAPILTRTSRVRENSDRFNSLGEVADSFPPATRAEREQKAREENALYKSGIACKFLGRDGDAVPGVSNEMVYLYSKRADEWRPGDRATAGAFLSGRKAMLKQEYSSYAKSRDSKASDISMTYSKPDNRSQTSGSGSSRTDISENTRKEMEDFIKKEMEDFDHAHKSTLSNVRTQGCRR